MRRQLLPALMMVILFSILTGVIYPLVVTGIGQSVF
jgi:K+-transporting ATPase ATPase C chain